MRIALVHMPFAAVELPSIALTQLQAAVARRMGDRVEVEICYPAHDVARHLGLDLYRRICAEAPASGLGDWLFRDLAFPGLPDNAAEYRLRYYPSRQQVGAFEEALAARPELDRLLDDAVARYGLDQADLVGFTSMFSQNAASFALARRLKEERPDLLTAIGGANCESPMGEEIALHVPAIDYVFSGPALVTFTDLVAALAQGDPAGIERAAAARGVLTRRKLQAGVRAAGLELGAELPIDDELPLDYGPFLDAFERAFAGTGAAPILLFETSRGCWWGERAHCTFCGLNGGTMSYRAMAPARAQALIRGLFAYRPRALQLSSVDIMPRDYPREVFATLGTPPDMSIFYEVKADLSDDDLALLSAAGVDSVQPGIESLATSVRWIEKVGRAVAGWAAPWRAGRPPLLCFERPGGTTIRDTRSGTEAIHEIGEGGRRVLAALVRPAALAELEVLAGGEPALDLGAELERLDSLGLLFEDRQRLLSLVLPRPPHAPRIAARYRDPAAAPQEPAAVAAAPETTAGIAR